MVLMTDRRSVYFNIAFFAILIVGFLIVNYFISSPGADAPVSFESAGLDRPLTPLSPATRARAFKDYRGAPILLHFWASWCEPCTRDEAKLKELYSAAAGHSAHFVDVASEDKIEAIRRAGKLNTYPGDSYVDPGGELALAFSVKTLPYTILIDKEGHVIFRGDGPLTEEDFGRLKTELASSSSKVLPSFDFPSAKGGTLSSETLADKTWVASFIFTSCGDTCPLISEKFRQVQEEFGRNPKFQLVSFSVDPARDTPERLLAFGKQHGADTAVWSFLRPPEKALRELMVEGFRLGTMESPLVHTAKLVVVGPGNSVASYIDGDAPDSVARLKTEIGKLLK